jgi:flagellin-like protein
MDSRGVSPMIATIVLIAIVFAVAAILALSLASAPTPSVIFGGMLDMENIENGRQIITIKHSYGDRANDALERTAANTWRWKNLELRLNGVIEDNIIQVISSGKDITTSATAGYYPLAVGDKVVVKLSRALTISDKVSLKWVPKNQTLKELEVTT